jgi:hypothetical protein
MRPHVRPATRPTGVADPLALLREQAIDALASRLYRQIESLDPRGTAVEPWTALAASERDAYRRAAREFLARSTRCAPSRQ